MTVKLKKKEYRVNYKIVNIAIDCQSVNCFQMYIMAILHLFKTSLETLVSLQRDSNLYTSVLVSSSRKQITWYVLPLTDALEKYQQNNTASS